MKGRVLIVAGSDPSGGAGIQADIKTVTMLGGYAAAAITSLTVQNTTGVKSVHPVAPEVIRAQIEAVLEDIGADAIKIGMIGSVESGEAILEALEASGWRYHGGHYGDQPPLILDPVLAATSGDSLSAAGLKDFINTALLPKSYLVTPNIDEAEALTGQTISDLVGQKSAAEILLNLGAETVLMKGGHAAGDEIIDYLATHTEGIEFRNLRIDSSSTHGTGCTLASAVATGLAQGLPLAKAVERAIAFVRAAMRAAPGFGKGSGPLGHAQAREGGDD